MFWQITSYPRCEYHVFPSHCALDRSTLVHRMYGELMRRRIVPWLDREDYYYGRDSRTALRDGLLRSRHVVFFITLGMMDYRRGWCPMELAYSDLLQANLTHAGGTLLTAVYTRIAHGLAAAPIDTNLKRPRGFRGDPLADASG